MLFETDGSAWIDQLFFEAKGRYEISIRAYGVWSRNEAAKLSLKLDGKELKTFQVGGTLRKPETFQVSNLMYRPATIDLSFNFANPDKNRERKAWH